MPFDVNLCRYTFLFGQPPYGFSENYYRDEAILTPPNDNPVDSALQSGAWYRLARARMALATPTLLLRGLRLSDPNKRGNVRVIAGGNVFNGLTLPTNGTFRVPNRHTVFTAPGVSATLQDTTPSGAETEKAVMIRVEAGRQHHRILLLRGVPENVVNEPNAYSFNTGGWRPRLAAFFQVLKTSNPLPGVGGNGFALKTLDQTAFVGANPIIALQVLSDPRWITVTTPTQVTLNVSNLAIGAKVYIKGVKGSSEINGIWQIANITTNAGPPVTYTYTLGPHRARAALDPKPVGVIFEGTIQALNYVGVQIDTAEDSDVTTRETGRPFGEPVGRRKTR
jgi:hypothetical protein